MAIKTTVSLLFSLHKERLLCQTTIPWRQPTFLLCQISSQEEKACGTFNKGYSAKSRKRFGFKVKVKAKTSCTYYRELKRCSDNGYQKSCIGYQKSWFPSVYIFIVVVVVVSCGKKLKL